MASSITEFTIEKRIPLPPKKTGGRGQSKYQILLNHMKKGDSVVVAENRGVQLRAAAKKLGMEVTCRNAEQKGMHRFWRIS